MNALMIKVLAVGLTLSQLFTRPPESFKNSFDPYSDQAQVATLLEDGCSYMIKEFNADDMDFGLLLGMMKANLEANNAAAKKQAEELGAEQPDAPKTLSARLFKQFDLGTMMAAYNSFCKKEKVENSPVKLDEVIAYYNKSLSDIGNHDASKLKNYKFVEASILLDQNDKKFTEVYSEHNRRYVVKIDELPPYLLKAFVAAEDQRFYEHNGLDIRGIVRAFALLVQNSGNDDGTAPRPEGGSTITQQVAKNLLTGADLTFERKIKEMILARQLESLYPTKEENKKNILYLYANEAFFGRACWGVECAAQNYFGIPAKALSVAQAATLAGLLRGPNYYHPDLHADRLLERRKYVLGRMLEDKYIDDETYKAALKEEMKFVAYEPPRTKGGYYFIDEINRQVRKLLNGESLTSNSFTVYSTLNSDLQRVTDAALRRGLMKYEDESGRAGKAQIVQGNIANEIARFHTSWREVLPKVRPKMYDLPWTLAVVTQASQKMRVGLLDGREMPLSGYNKTKLGLYDLVFVDVIESKKNPRASLKVPPTVQGAVVVLENRTGKVLAMTGGFSYAQSQFNRVTQGARQPGSTLKPFIYLSALSLGYQPNTLIPDIPVEFPGIVRNGDSWTPKNYDGGSRGLVTMRTAIEKSLNLPTARMAAALGETPAEGLDYVRGITQDLGIYTTTERFYPFVLGAQPARVLNMAAAYATVANLGLRPTPQFIEKIVKDDRVIYQRPRFQLQSLNNSDRVSFYQLRHILEGVLVRGTATSMKEMVGCVGGKTGTSNDERDAWFVGFTNDITVAVWVGYDNRHIRSNLGSRFTGGRVALPIAAEVLRQSFKVYKPMEPFTPPPPEVKEQTVEINIDIDSGETGVGSYPEIFRIDPSTKKPRDTRTQILTPSQLAQMSISFPQGEEDNESQVPYYDGNDARTYSPQWTADGQPYQPGYEDVYDGWSRRPRQIDQQFASPGFFRPQGGR